MSPIDYRNCCPIVSDDNSYSETLQGNAEKVTNMFTLTCSSFFSAHCFEVGYVGISHCLGKNIMQSAGNS